MAQTRALSRTGWERFVRMLSDNTIRKFLARMTNNLTSPTATETVSRRLQQPKFLPETSHMQLPMCASFESTASRMAVALRLGECGVTTQLHR